MLTDDPKRKDFMLAWLKALDGAYAVEVGRFALMGNHFHAVVRVNLELAQAWSPMEVVARWVKLHPPRDGRHRPLHHGVLGHRQVVRARRLVVLGLVALGRRFSRRLTRLGGAFGQRQGGAGQRQGGQQKQNGREAAAGGGEVHA